MKGKILKIVTAILLLALLTMPNFIFVGAGLVSYAVDSIATNHQNVEFGAKLNEGNILEILINVKKEGYFNGEISLENNNFTFKLDQENPYINKIESNKITLNQINAGSNVQIDLEVQPITDEIFDVAYLSAVSKVNIKGIYRDSSQKDIKIASTREVRLEYTEDNTNEDVESTANIITNKIVKISGEDKRVVQLEMILGLKENNYPIQKINSIIKLPKIEGKNPEVVKKVDLNTMRDFTYNYDGENKIELLFENEAKQENDNKILWKKQGNEKAIITLIYDKEVTFENSEISYEQIVTLYNEKELKANNKLVMDNEEKDKLITIVETNKEDSIYKGKLYEGIDRQIETKTNIDINLANAEQYIKINENEAKYLLEDGQEISANVVFDKTVINKDSFDRILGESGKLTISNGEEIVATVNANTIADENNNIVINYEGKELKTLNIITTTPISEGNLELIHTKTIKAQEKDIVKMATNIETKFNYEYIKNEVKENNSSIRLEDTKPEVQLELDKDTLSTVVANTVEMKAILKGNNEKYELYKNPTIVFELPQDTESLVVNDVKLVYEDELEYAKYDVIDNKLLVYLVGEQTKYKDESIDGAIVIVNATINIDKKAASKDSEIIMTVVNEDKEILSKKDMRIVAPTDITVINSIKELNVETIGQNDKENVELERGAEAKQLEVNIETINNNENSVEDVKIMGTFPTKNSENNIDIKIVEGITVDNIEGAKVYYTENEEASDNLEDKSNDWKEEIEDENNVKKYLIEVPNIESQSNVEASYRFEIPELLEYNQEAEEGYTARYTNTLTRARNEIAATSIALGTGVGPVLETRLIQTVGGKELTSNETVKNGEVIKYIIEVSNTGSEDLTDVMITGIVPEGTSLVKPQDNFEYAGSSYYEELQNRAYEAAIDSLAVGEVKKGEYEVRVNNDTQAGTILNNVIQTRYGDVIKNSNETSVATENGDIRVTVKRVTSTKINLYENGYVKYFAIVENISNNELQNVKVRTGSLEGLEVNGLDLITNINDRNNVNSEEIDYQELINIGSLEQGEAKVLSYTMLINRVENLNKREFSVTARTGNKEYRSNIIGDSIRIIDVSLNMTTNTESQYVESGDKLDYIITVTNNAENDIEGLLVKDSIPKTLTVKKVTLNGEEIPILEGTNNIEIYCNIEAKSNVIIEIETLVNYKLSRVSPEIVTNISHVQMSGEDIAETSELIHIIEPNQEVTSTDDTNSDQEDSVIGKHMITGIAWFDENADGKKDAEEKTLSNIKVQLLDTQTNSLVKDKKGKVVEATTNDKGVYLIDNIANGKYIAIFDYDKTKYALTKYKVQDVEESKNSNTITSELLVENEKQQVASTDIIEINNNNISNINIGLIELKDFEFRLDKYVSRILIQNSRGTVVKEYTNASVAKAELDSKTVNGTTVIIEYELKVTNIGEIDGYVRKIVDYVPSDLKFSSELNKDWYQVGSDLYSTSLANEKIAVGESKSVRLTLTKAMTEDNTGLINNTAEIAESYNELGIKDSKSTGGNKVQGENDYSSADTILSLKTGDEVYATFIAIGIILLGITTILIVRKKQNIEDIK